MLSSIPIASSPWGETGWPVLSFSSRQMSSSILQGPITLDVYINAYGTPTVPCGPQRGWSHYQRCSYVGNFRRIIRGPGKPVFTEPTVFTWQHRATSNRALLSVDLVCTCSLSPSPLGQSSFSSWSVFISVCCLNCSVTRIQTRENEKWGKWRNTECFSVQCSASAT